MWISCLALSIDFHMHHLHGFIKCSPYLSVNINTHYTKKTNKKTNKHNLKPNKNKLKNLLIADASSYRWLCCYERAAKLSFNARDTIVIMTQICVCFIR